jgi:hypothetical protein
MRVRSAAAASFVLVLAATASAGLNKSIMVPVYEECVGAGNCFPPKRASSYTFDSITLLSSQKPYTAPGKFSLAVIVKGLKDASGNPVTGTLTLRIAPGRVTILSQNLGTLGEAFSPETVYPVIVKNGEGKPRLGPCDEKTSPCFRTPAVTPEHGLIVNTFSAPVLYDPEGKPLASTGAQSKP